MRVNADTLSCTSAHSIEKLLLPLSVMTAGEPDPVQWICRRRAPISTSWPKGGGGGAALSCAVAGRANASRMRTESTSMLLVTQSLLSRIGKLGTSKAATALLRGVSRGGVRQSRHALPARRLAVLAHQAPRAAPACPLSQEELHHPATSAAGSRAA